LRVELARSLWAISRPFPSEQFLEVWDFRVEACVTQDGDHFVFGDFVIVVATFVDGLDDCVCRITPFGGGEERSFVAGDHGANQSGSRWAIAERQLTRRPREQ
jgi:hypothetical protein